MITEAHVTAMLQHLDPHDQTKLERGDPKYPVGISDLLRFGEFSARWVRTPKPDERPKPRSIQLLLPELRSLGWVEEGDHLRHPDVADTRNRAITAARARRASALLAAATRWEAAKALTPAPDLPPAKPDRFATTGQTDPDATLPPPCERSAPSCAPADASAMPTDMRAHCAGNASPMQLSKVKNVRTKEGTLLSKPGTALTPLDSERLTVNPLTSTLTVSPRPGEAESEKDFLAGVREQFSAYSPARAESELTNFGGWWRNRFRESPDRARRVLAEIGSMCRERRIHSSPGAAAADLWSRLP